MLILAPPLSTWCWVQQYIGSCIYILVYDINKSYQGGGHHQVVLYRGSSASAIRTTIYRGAIRVYRRVKDYTAYMLITDKNVYRRLNPTPHPARCSGTETNDRSHNNPSEKQGAK